MKKAVPRKVRDALGHLVGWPLLWMSWKIAPARHYDLLGDRVLPFNKVPLCNMGYWEGINQKQPHALESANESLFHLACEKSEVKPHDKWVVDAGCGFGTNPIYCVRNYQPRRMTGINFSSVQLGTASRLLAEAQLQDRIDFVMANATRMPFAGESVDKVLSIEAAFHFDTREDFFRDAYRILRPGGLLSLFDIVVPPPRNGLEKMLLLSLRHGQHIPATNVYGVEEYTTRLQTAGLDVIEAESIRSKVLEPFLRWFARRPITNSLRVNAPWAIASLAFLFYPLEYVCVKAKRK